MRSAKVAIITFSFHFYKTNYSICLANENNNQRASHNTTFIIHYRNKSRAYTYVIIFINVTKLQTDNYLYFVRIQLIQ